MSVSHSAGRWLAYKKYEYLLNKTENRKKLNNQIKL